MFLLWRNRPSLISARRRAEDLGPTLRVVNLDEPRSIRPGPRDGILNAGVDQLDGELADQLAAVPELDNAVHRGALSVAA